VSRKLFKKERKKKSKAINCRSKQHRKSNELFPC
jgi:hypothetical protein